VCLLEDFKYNDLRRNPWA